MKTSLTGDNKLIMKHCSGVTLIEILVALVLGLLITAGIFQLYSSNRQSYRLAEGQSRLQENARFALEFLSHDFRMAGYMGCLSRSLSLNSTLNNPTNYLYNFETPVQGFEWNEIGGVWLPTSVPAPAPLPSPSTVDTGTAVISPLPGSDIITVRRADTQSFSIITHTNPSADIVLNFSSAANVKKGNFLVASNCKSATVFQKTGPDDPSTTAMHVACDADPGTPPLPCIQTPGNAEADLGRNYSDGNVYKISTTSYFIRALNGVPTLYRRINSQGATALVEGIEAMEILYGADTTTDGTANQYFKALGVTDWSEIVSVRIKILVRSIEDNLVLQASNFSFNDITFPYGGGTDRRLRREFTTTIAIRNRLR